MPEVNHVYFPFDSNLFTIELWEKGNAPDYSVIYNQGVKAARGDTESYELKNCPKGDPSTEVEVTGNVGSDIMKYNYIGIDYGVTGDGKKWYFVKSKRILNYPTVINGAHQMYTVLYSIELDVWETYKDKIGTPNILLSQVTTSTPGNWYDLSMMEQDVLPFSGTKITVSDAYYTNWKTIVGWQSKKPTAQDNFTIDGMRTTLQFNETGELDDYLEGLDDLANGTVAETQIWRSYLVCNTYIVSEYFSTKDGGHSAIENLNVANPPSTQAHNRLNFYPYKRAFIKTVDGQAVELDYKKYSNNRLPDTIQCYVYHSTLPQPTSVIVPRYYPLTVDDVIVFNSYPTMDFVGKNITPITQLSNIVKDVIAFPGEMMSQPKSFNGVAMPSNATMQGG